LEHNYVLDFQEESFVTFGIIDPTMMTIWHDFIFSYSNKSIFSYLNHMTRIECALNREWRKCELSRGKISSHSIKLFIPSNDISDFSIHTSPMVMKSKKAISTLNSKVSKFWMYLLNKTRSFMRWGNHSVALW
jgi:hypothetical protein